jgi:hypothetical protein
MEEAQLALENSLSQSNNITGIAKPTNSIISYKKPRNKFLEQLVINVDFLNSSHIEISKFFRINSTNN